MTVRKRRATLTGLPRVRLSHDEVARLLEPSTDADSVERWVGEMISAGRFGAARAIAAWIDLAQEWGQSPDTGLAAKVAGVPVTFVALSVRECQQSIRRVRELSRAAKRPE